MKTLSPFRLPELQEELQELQEDLADLTFNINVVLSLISELTEETIDD